MNSPTTTTWIGDPTIDQDDMDLLDEVGFTHVDYPELVEPQTWHRIICEVAQGILVSGDLHHDETIASRQLDGWQAAGVTRIVDCRGEWTDANRVAEHAPQITYTHVGTHDEGGSQESAGFDAGVGAITDALDDPTARVLVHCHMGINRAPSMAYAAMLDLGYGLVEGLDAIRAARPIAAIAYASSAVQWFGQRNGWDETEIADACQTVCDWHTDNPINIGWIISRIRTSARDTS